MCVRVLAIPLKLDRYPHLCNGSWHDGGVWRHHTANCQCAVNNRRGHDLNVTRLTRLRDVQEIVCRLFRMPFPRTKACITVGGITYDEFADMPFLGCNGKDVMTVVFIRTDDPYFYDLRDRRPHPCTPPFELENALAVSPLELPPPIMLD